MLKLGNTYISFGGTYLTDWVDPYNPLDLPAYTIQLKYNDGITPSFRNGTATQVSQSPNIWNLTYENTDWQTLMYNDRELVEVLGANVNGVTIMRGMFRDCRNLTKVSMFNTFSLISADDMFFDCRVLRNVSLFNTSKVTNIDGMFYDCYVLNDVPLFDTSNVSSMGGTFMQCKELTTVPKFNTSNGTDMNGTFANCYRLSSVPLLDTSRVVNMYDTFANCDLRYIPLFDTSNVTNMNGTFINCHNVTGGALALYQQASTQSYPPTHNYTFAGCGSNTQTGSAELAQIPSDWK